MFGFYLCNCWILLYPKWIFEIGYHFSEMNIEFLKLFIRHRSILMLLWYFVRLITLYWLDPRNKETKLDIYLHNFPSFQKYYLVFLWIQRYVNGFEKEKIFVFLYGIGLLSVDWNAVNLQASRFGRLVLEACKCWKGRVLKN